MPVQNGFYVNDYSRWQPQLQLGDIVAKAVQMRQANAAAEQQRQEQAMQMDLTKMRLQAEVEGQKREQMKSKSLGELFKIYQQPGTPAPVPDMAGMLGSLTAGMGGAPMLGSMGTGALGANIPKTYNAPNMSIEDLQRQAMGVEMQYGSPKEQMEAIKGLVPKQQGRTQEDILEEIRARSASRQEEMKALYDRKDALQRSSDSLKLLLDSRQLNGDAYKIALKAYYDQMNDLQATKNNIHEKEQTTPPQTTLGEDGLQYAYVKNTQTGKWEYVLAKVAGTTLTQPSIQPPPISLPQPSAPQPSAPQPSAPQPSAPQPSAPQPVTQDMKVSMPEIPSDALKDLANRGGTALSDEEVAKMNVASEPESLAGGYEIPKASETAPLASATSTINAPGMPFKPAQKQTSSAWNSPLRMTKLESGIVNDIYNRRGLKNATNRMANVEKFEAGANEGIDKIISMIDSNPNIEYDDISPLLKYTLAELWKSANPNRSTTEGETETSTPSLVAKFEDLAAKMANQSPGYIKGQLKSFKTALNTTVGAYYKNIRDQYLAARSDLTAYDTELKARGDSRGLSPDLITSEENLKDLASRSEGAFKKANEAAEYISGISSPVLTTPTASASSLIPTQPGEKILYDAQGGQYVKRSGLWLNVTTGKPFKKMGGQ